MEDNTEIAEEMSLGNLNHIPKRKLLAFFLDRKINCHRLFEKQKYIFLK